MSYIDLPEGYDEELDDFIFDWSLTCEPEWDPSKFDIDQVLPFQEGTVTVAVTEDTTVRLVGPVTLREFIKKVNEGLCREMEEKGIDDGILAILGDHHFPEYLKRTGANSYVLCYGS